MPRFKGSGSKKLFGDLLNMWVPLFTLLIQGDIASPGINPESPSVKHPYKKDQMVHKFIFDSDFLYVFGQEKEWRKKKRKIFGEGKYFLLE